MMHILVVTNLYPPHSIGGYEQVCKDAVDGLRRKGHHVEVLTTTYGATRATSDDGIHRVLRPTALWPDYPNAFRPTNPMALTRWSVTSNQLMRTLLHAVRPDVVYAWNIAGLPIGLLTNAQKSRVPIVWSIHDVWPLEHVPHQSDPWTRAWVERLTSPAGRMVKNLLNRVIDPIAPVENPAIQEISAQFVSGARRKMYTERGWNFSRERVIYNGINLDVYHPTDVRDTAGLLRLLIVGRIHPEKGIHVAIAALATMAARRRHGTLTLTVAGPCQDSHYLATLRAQVADLGRSALVDFRGPVVRTEAAQMYRGHDVLLLPSICEEGVSLAVLEALACGLGVVVSDTGGTTEVVEHDVTGLVVPPNDVDALATAVTRLVDDRELAARLRRNGLKRIRQHFNQELTIGEVETYLQEVIEASRPKAVGNDLSAA